MILRRLAPLLVLASVVAAALPYLAETLALARRLAFVAKTEQRHALDGSWMEKLSAIRPRLAGATEVFIVAAREEDIGAAALASAELFPLRTHLYVGTEDFLNETARRNLHPRAILWANRAGGQQLSLATYSDIAGSGLDAALRRRIEAVAPSPEAIDGKVIVPLVVSARGTESDAYMTSLLITNASPGRARVELTFHSSGGPKVRAFVLDRGERLRAWDAARELFASSNASGWIEARMSRPITITAALVNSGRGPVDRLETLQEACGGSVLHVSPRDAAAMKLWLLNSGAHSATVTWVVDEEAEQSVTVPARTLHSITAPVSSSCSSCRLTIDSVPDCSIVAFLSEKDHATGATSFGWPRTVTP